MAKNFLNYQEQITHLVEDRNLIVTDRVYAEEVLKQIGYFPLVSSYKSPFKNPITGKYRKGTRFEDLVYLYKFDENLRELFLKYILKVECHLKSLIAYYFTEKYGDRQAAYLNPDHYVTAPGRRAQVLYMVDQLGRLLSEGNDSRYIEEQRKRHGNVPLWILINGLTFGMLAKLYSVLTPDLKVKVSKNFPGVNEKQLEQFLNVMTKFRNVCAHNERLFSYQANRDIPDTPIHRKVGIPQRNEQFVSGKRDLFSMMIALWYLLPENDFKKFKRHFTQILRHYLTYSKALSYQELLGMMGFPVKWQGVGRK
ncbi:MAG: Abi family protein [Clostridia bacterium]|nr:Abi family protein [Clostridia bacterium]